MSQQITISASTGTGPFSVYVCDTTLTTCNLITTTATIPPNVQFSLSGAFATVTSVIIKVVDSLGCEVFHQYQCPQIGRAHV